MNKLILIAAIMVTTTLANAALIKQRTVRWQASTSSDVTAHLVYVRPAGTAFSYDQQSAEVAVPATSYALPGVFTMAEGNYSVAVVAKDGVGNLSDQTEVTSFFDMTAPLSATNVRVD